MRGFWEKAFFSFFLMRKRLSTGQKWFMRPYLPLIRGMFVVRSGLRNLFRALGRNPCLQWFQKYQILQRGWQIWEWWSTIWQVWSGESGQPGASLTYNYCQLCSRLEANFGYVTHNELIVQGVFFFNFSSWFPVPTWKTCCSQPEL